jgi:hypothetical protein
VGGETLDALGTAVQWTAIELGALYLGRAWVLFMRRRDDD